MIQEKYKILYKGIDYIWLSSPYLNIGDITYDGDEIISEHLMCYDTPYGRCYKYYIKH